MGKTKIWRGHNLTGSVIKGQRIPLQMRGGYFQTVGKKFRIAIQSQEKRGGRGKKEPGGRGNSVRSPSEGQGQRRMV